MPKVSVLMPVYKTEESHLREAIESILNQTFGDFEFLILDDCPEDDRESIVTSYSDTRIKYLKNEKNMGITPSRNKLIDISTSEYLAIFDHDDVSAPNRLEKEVTYLENNPDVGVISCNMHLFPGTKETHHPQNDIDIKTGLMEHDVIAHTAAMIRKSVLTEHNIRYEEEFSPSEDYGLWCRLIKVTKFHNLPEVLLHYRKHPNNTSKHQQDKMELATVLIRSIMQTEYPTIYSQYQQRATYTTQVKLFGAIPLFKITQEKHKTSILLFNKLPILKIKKTSRLGMK